MKLEISTFEMVMLSNRRVKLDFFFLNFFHELINLFYKLLGLIKLMILPNVKKQPMPWVFEF